MILKGLWFFTFKIRKTEIVIYKSLRVFAHAFPNGNVNVFAVILH